MLQQFAQGAGEITQSYREILQTLNPVIAQPQFTVEEVAEIETFAAPQIVTGVGTQFQNVTVSAISGGRWVAPFI